MTTFYSQINDHDLIECRDLANLNLDEGYSIVPCVSKFWKRSDARLLVIVESVDSLDIRNGSLLTGTTVDEGKRKGQKFGNHNPMRSVFSALLDKAVSMLRPYGEDVADKFAFGIANFNAQKIKQLAPSEQLAYFPRFTKRLLAIIERLKPTHVLVCGDTATHQLLRNLGWPEDTPKHLQGENAADNSMYKRGWVFKRKLKNHEFFMCPTLDIEPLYNVRKIEMDDDEDDDGMDNSDRYAAGDLLYFVTRNICNLFAERMLHDLSHIKPKAKLVDTMEKFKAMMEELWTAPVIAIDSETQNLSSYHNKLVTIQFATTSKYGYVVPVMHSKGPFTGKQQRIILRRLRELFMSKEAKTLIFTNGMFDLRIARSHMNMPIIPYHRIHEITAGEQLLDENLGLFGRLKFYYMGRYTKSSYQNLRAMCCMYGNDLYWRMAFSKEERMFVDTLPYDDPNVLAYETLDVQLPFAIAAEQRKRAEHLYVKPNVGSKLTKYSHYFERHCHNQMSNTVQGISHMEQHGAHTDIEYLNHLRSKQSPLLSIIKETRKELTAMPSAQKANARLLRKSGKSENSLWGSTVTVNIFDPNKKEHKEALFFDVLKLEPIGFTKTGQRAIDKNFTAAYKETVPEVAKLETITKASKLSSTYVKGWMKKILNHLDSKVDACLRASYGFFTIVSGRLNSFDPSLQQIPSRGKLAYYIKRMFTPPPGCLCVKDDYSSHEVRVWSIISGDDKVSSGFQAGLDLRRELIKTPLKDEKTLDHIRKELKKKGDSHIQSVYRIFGKWVEKSDPLRDAVKALIFGALYGKSSRTMGQDLKLNKLKELRAKLKEKEEALKKLLVT